MSDTLRAAFLEAIAEIPLGNRTEADKIVHEVMSVLQWKPIDTAPENERIWVCGWMADYQNVAGYWWYEEDIMYNYKPFLHPEATHWCPILLPAFPDRPEDAA